MNKKKIICFVEYYLPGYKSGGPIRTVSNLVKVLDNNYLFYIVTSDRDFNDKKPYQNIKTNQWSNINKSFVFYISKFIYYFLKFPEIFKHNSYDYIYLNSFFSFKFSILIIILRFLRFIPYKKLILAPRGEFSNSALKIKIKRKAIYLQIFKFFRLYKDITWQASSIYEYNDIKKIFNQSKIIIALDVPELESPKISKNKILAMKPLKIVFLARISPIKNLDFAIKVLSKLKIKILFEIVGPVSNKNFWQNCQKLLNTLPKNISYRYLGSINHNDVTRVFKKNHLYFLPTKSENFGHTILESLSVGTPVLISDQTPWRNLSVFNAGWDIPLVEIDQYVDVINNLSKLSASEYQKKRFDCLLYHKSNINIKKIIKSYENLFS